MPSAAALPSLLLLSLAVLTYPGPVRGRSWVVHLQEDGVARDDSGLTWHHTLPVLTTFTFCTRLYSFRSRYSDYFFSYAVPENDNELAFHLKYHKKQLRLACCAKKVFQIMLVDVRLLSWFSFCVAVNLTSSAATFVHSNGTERVTLFDSLGTGGADLKVTGGGSVVLGQDQDEPRGGTDRGQSFNGYLADMYLGRDLLTEKQMQDFVGCRVSSLPAPGLLNFLHLRDNFTLGAMTALTEAVSPCQPGSDTMFSVFPEPRTAHQAAHLCSILDGRVAAPNTSEENLSLFHEGSRMATQCTKYDNGGSVWIGITWVPDNRIWATSSTSTEATYKNFEADFQPSSQEVLCVVAATLGSPEGNWDIESCTHEICTACQFHRPTPMKLRGLCAESLFDREYYIYNTANLRPVFNGNRWSQLSWTRNETGSGTGWQLYLLADTHVHARMMSASELTYPVGVHEYEVVGDKCPWQTRRLKLTSCRPDQYTCGDGVCVELDQRCNLELNCADGSDELDCDTLVIPPGYEKLLPPPKPSTAMPATITIICEIMLVRYLDLLGSRLTFDIALTRIWQDSRLRYKNLHTDHNLNLVDGLIERVWYPVVDVLGSDNSHATIVNLADSAWGHRVTAPLPDDDQTIDEDVYYSGKVNQLVLKRELTITLMCTFDLTLYPFDTQHCPIIFYVRDYTASYVSTSLKELSFSGTRRLLEYRVTGLRHKELLHQNRSGQHVEILLANQFGYYISGAYVPTMLLVVISYLTFYFSLQDFTNRVMVSLTSLLVLAALFSQIASGLPKTAYLKLIDVWFIFCILSDFVMVFVLVVINCHLESPPLPPLPPLKCVAPLSSLPPYTACSLPRRKAVFTSHLEKRDGSLCGLLNPRRCNSLAQFVLPVLLGLFLVVYFGCVAYHMGRVQDDFQIQPN